MPIWVSRCQKKHSPTHHPEHHPVFISFFHLPRSIASSFKLRAWHSFCTTSFHVLFGLPLGLEFSTSYSIHFFTSEHIVSQQANRYIVALHIAISYDTQRPRYNGQAVGLCTARMVCVTLTDRCMRWQVHCSAWLQRVKWDRRRRAHLMFEVQGHGQCATETGTIYDVFTDRTRRWHGLTWAGAWWSGLVSRYTDSFSQL